MSEFVCPADHPHAAKLTCAVSHGCRCEPCLTMIRAYRAEQYRAKQAQRTATRGPGRPLSPCGTTAAYARHVRRGEEIDDACREANRRRKQEEAEQARAAAMAKSAPAVEFDGATVTITASLDDARALAAAALDRAMALEKVAGSTGVAVDQREKGEMLRAVHKRLATIARAAA